MYGFITEKKYKVSKLIDGLTRLQMNDTIWLTVIPAKYSDLHIRYYKSGINYYLMNNNRIPWWKWQGVVKMQNSCGVKKSPVNGNVCLYDGCRKQEVTINNKDNTQWIIYIISTTCLSLHKNWKRHKTDKWMKITKIQDDLTKFIQQHSCPTMNDHAVSDQQPQHTLEWTKKVTKTETEWESDREG